MTYRWPAWAATVEEASAALDAVAQELTDVEDDAAATLRSTLGTIEEVADLLRTRAEEYAAMEAEDEAADAEAERASIIIEPDEYDDDAEDIEFDDEVDTPDDYEGDKHGWMPA